MVIVIVHKLWFKLAIHRIFMWFLAVYFPEELWTWFLILFSLFWMVKTISTQPEATIACWDSWILQQFCGNTDKVLYPPPTWARVITSQRLPQQWMLAIGKNCVIHCLLSIVTILISNNELHGLSYICQCIKGDSTCIALYM